MIEPEPRSDSRMVVDLRTLSTRWSEVRNPQSFVLRYVHPIRSYLSRLFQDEDDVEEVLQRFMVKILERKFDSESVREGRFRNYLIRAIRNEAVSWQRERTRKAGRTFTDVDLTELAPSEKELWDRDWYDSLLERGWLTLLSHEETNPQNWCHTVLSLATDNPELSSEELSLIAGSRIGHAITPTAFRKQLSRARSLLAKELVNLVAETIEAAGREELLDELRLLGLAPLVEPYIDLEFRSSLIGVGKSGFAGLPSLRTVRAVLPHTALRLAGPREGVAETGVGLLQTV
ncbi:MAG: sigma-70 family RNA polymerase sigma factor, partial [Planctomycetota bacterium]